MRIFITGILGQLGYNLATLLYLDGHDIMGSINQSHRFPDFLSNKIYQLNLYPGFQLLDQVQKIPKDIDLFIHCAAYTDVNQSEYELSKVYKINSESTHFLSNWANNYNIPFLYISTDFVFEGYCDGNNELTLPNPQGHYSRSKYFGELNCKSKENSHIIRWTPLVHCFSLPHHPPNFTNWLINSTKQKAKLQLFCDKTLTPVSSLQIANAIRKPNLPELLHVPSLETNSVHQLATSILNYFDLPNNHHKTKFPSTNSYGKIRPQHSGLDTLLFDKKSLVQDFEECKNLIKTLPLNWRKKLGSNPLLD